MKENEPLKGLRCSIFTGCEGVSELSTIAKNHDEVTLVGANVARIFPETQECPAVRLHVIGDGELWQCVVVRPVAPGPEGWIGPMFGGAFIFTSDSRFPGHSRPIPLHDRWESPNTYRELSR